MLKFVALVRMDVSEERIPSINMSSISSQRAPVGNCC
jgi:hypothetical protein